MICQLIWCKDQECNPRIRKQEHLKHNRSEDHLRGGKIYIAGTVERMDMVCISVPTQEGILEMQEVPKDKLLHQERDQWSV